MQTTGVVRVIAQYFFSHLQDLPCIDEAWGELIEVLRSGMLCFRVQFHGEEEANVALEIFTSHTKAACQLMVLVGGGGAKGNADANSGGRDGATDVRRNQLWRSLWDTVCDFGEPDDLARDMDETMAKSFLQITSSVFLKRRKSNSSSRPHGSGNSVPMIHETEPMLLKFVALAERVACSRPARVRAGWLRPPAAPRAAAAATG